MSPDFSRPSRKPFRLRSPSLTCLLRSRRRFFSPYLRRKADEFWKTSGALPPAAWVLNLLQKSAYSAKSVFTVMFGYFFSKSFTVFLIITDRSLAPHQA